MSAEVLLFVPPISDIMNDKNSRTEPPSASTTRSLPNPKAEFSVEVKDSTASVGTSSQARISTKTTTAAQSRGGIAKNAEGNGGTHSSQPGAESEFKCQYCGRGFLFRNNLKCHLRTHIRDKKYTCNICEKSFIYKESLKNHMLLHSNELPYQCDICMKKFRDRSNRRKHVKNVHKFLLAAGGVGGVGTATTSGNGDGNGTMASTSQTKRRRRTTSKKKESVPPDPSSVESIVPVPPKRTSPVYLANIQSEVKSEPMSPALDQRQETSPDTAQTHLHHLHHHRQQHYLQTPSLTHPDVIVYSKPKCEGPEMTYSRESSNRGDNQEPPRHEHQYFGNYNQQQSYVGLMTSHEVDRSEQHMIYEPPTTSYVTTMSLIPPPRLRTDETMTRHSSPSTQAYIQQHMQEQYSSHLLYSSPLMSMGDSLGTHDSYWVPAGNPSANQSETPSPHSSHTESSRSYYSPEGQLPAATDGNILINAPSPYPPASLPVAGQPPPQQHSYFYTDLSQFDLSRL